MPPHCLKNDQFFFQVALLVRQLREHGINSYHDVALAVLEVDGSISCLKYDEIQPTAKTHLARRKFLQKHE